MGAVISYDDQCTTPSSETKLDSGEHIFLALDRKGLVIKSFGSGTDRILYKGDPDTVAKICAGLFDDRGESKATPLQILASAVVNLPNANAVQKAFKAADDAV